ncbi:MAG: cytochrome P450 [Rhodobacteraceae bacterium]|nr:cytochrome P450 [Paracoccaceae bacterium]
MNARPASLDVDLYSDEIIREPYETYRALRDAGSAVWLPRHELWAVARFEEVRQVLRDHRRFSSARGVAANEETNRASMGTTLASDPPLHTEQRKIIVAPLMPGALAPLRAQIEATADDLIARLVARGSFDAMSDLARVLPVSIVSDLVGLPEEGRQNLLKWAAATFDILGVMNERAREAVPAVQEMRAYTVEQATPERLRPGSWAARLYEAAAEGKIPVERCPAMMRDYMAPSLDTTILGTGNILWLLARHPDQWELLRANPDLIPSAINEGLRLESPIRGFTRLLNTATRLGDTELPEGARVLALYASANRDERKWDEPERFDITRKATEQLGFGHGIHTCAGMHLARLEIGAILSALVRRVRRIEVEDPVFAYNNVLRGFDSLPMRLQ